MIVDKLTKLAHFIPVKIDYSMDRLSELYVDEIVRLHGVPLSIVTPRPDEVHSTCNCKGAYVHQVPL